MSNRDMPWFAWFPTDFAASTAGWTFLERSVYRALLDLQWEQGLIYEDLRRLSCAIGVDLRTLQKCWRVVGPKFSPVEGGLQNHRLEEHRLAAIELRKKKVAAARVRWSSAQAQHMQMHKQSTSAGSASAQAMHMPPHSHKNKTLPPYPPSRKRPANGQGGRGAPESSGAIREDDPEIVRKRKEAETLAAQHAKPAHDDDDGMPF